MFKILNLYYIYILFNSYMCKNLPNKNVNKGADLFYVCTGVV